MKIPTVAIVGPNGDRLIINRDDLKPSHKLWKPKKKSAAPQAPDGDNPADEATNEEAGEEDNKDGSAVNKAKEKIKEAAKNISATFQTSSPSKPS